MRLSAILVFAIVGGGFAGYLGACGSGGDDGSDFDGGNSPDGGTRHGDGGPTKDATRLSNDSGRLVQQDTGSPKKPDGDRPYDATGAAAAAREAVTLTNATIVPGNDMITVGGGQQATVNYKVMAVEGGQGAPVDVTDRFVFFVPGTVMGQPNDYLIGSFPSNGGPAFTTRLPVLPTDPPQEGGTLTVQAEAYNPGATADAAPTLISLSTELTVVLDATFSGPITPVDEPDGSKPPDASAVPPDAAGLFGGPANAAFAPTIAYPNDGVMLPPNLKFLEVHWVPAPGTTLFEVSFNSATANIVYDVRCGTVPNGPFSSNGCALVLDPTGYGDLASSNAGAGPVTVTVKGTDNTGSGVGTSPPITIQFAENPVNGGVYYWNVSATEIMRFDFGGTGLTPEVFLGPGDYGLSEQNDNGGCVGCHALSADGTKIVASIGGQGYGNIVYLNNLASPPGDAGFNNDSYLTLAGDTTNLVQFSSFDPSGDEFVAVYGDSPNNGVSPSLPDGGLAASGGAYSASAPGYDQLWIHDGNTGKIRAGYTLPFEPDHPAWSPDGNTIAVTHVGVHQTAQREFAGGIDVIPVEKGQDGGTLGLGTALTLVPSMVKYQNAYNPSWAPDSSFLYYTLTADCAAADWTTAGDEVCDSDVHLNTNATTYAILPQAGATPIHLANAATPGYADRVGVKDGGVAPPIDTFARSTPFETVQGNGKLFWFTVASERKPGLRTPVLDSDGIQQTLWMFAVDPAKILAGEDGSYPGFFLPFQDMTTSNHIAQWTQKIVSSSPTPPGPPPPPVPDAAPPPPPPPVDAGGGSSGGPK